MSIKGLWKILKRFVRDGHLSQFRGQRVAIDMYVWLHRAIIGSVTINQEKLLPYLYAKLVEGNTAAHITLEEVLVVTDQYLTSMIDKVHHLQRFGIIPVCVFDGTEMPMKQGTDEARQARRDAAFAKAMHHFEDAYSVQHATLRSPSHSLSEGIRELERAVDISTEMAHTVIQILQEERHVECLVAPYEADAQLSYLCREGYVQAVLSEDSDLIAYFCPCIISKLDKTGRCDVVKPPEVIPGFFAEINAQLRARRGSGALHAASSPVALAPTSPSFTSPNIAPPSSPGSGTGYTYESFLLGCVLSGCDYVRSLHGIGITKAFRLVCQSQSLPQLMRALHDEYGFPEDELQRYRHQVLAAFYCFAHHIVYCPRLKQLTLLHPLPNLTTPPPALKSDLVGFLWPHDVAQKVCEECLYDPCTHRLYRGIFQKCVDQYMKRTRQGQTSLRTFNGFEALSSAKVVIRKRGHEPSTAERTAQHIAGVVKLERVVKQEKLEEEEDESETFRQPLQRVRRVSGFFSGGSGAPAPVGASVSALGHHASAVDAPPVPSRALVRSKYFLQCTAVIEAGDSDTDATSEDDEGDDEEDEHHHEEGSRAHGSPLAAGAASPRSSSAFPSASRTVTATVAHGCAERLRAGAADGTVHHTTQITAAPSHASAARETMGSLSGSDGAGSSASWRPLASSNTHTPSSSSPSDSRQDGSVTTHTSAESLTQDNLTAPSLPCVCPFGYWQCNQSHSIFVQCFQGKAWVRGEALAAPLADSPGRLTQDSGTASDADDDEVDAHRVKATHGVVVPRLMAPSTLGSSSSASSLPKTTTTAGPTVHVLGAFRPPRALSRSSSSATGPDSLSSQGAEAKHAHPREAHHTRSPIRALDENAERHSGHQVATAAHGSAKKDASRLFESLTFSKSEGRGR